MPMQKIEIEKKKIKEKKLVKWTTKINSKLPNILLARPTLGHSARDKIMRREPKELSCVGLIDSQSETTN